MCDHLTWCIMKVHLFPTEDMVTSSVTSSQDGVTYPRKLYLRVIYIYIYIIGQVGRVFANGPGDLGSIPSRVIPKTLNMVLDTSLLNTQQYKVHIKGKEEQSGKGVAPSPTPQCSSYWKGSLLVVLD